MDKINLEKDYSCQRSNLTDIQRYRLITGTFINKETAEKIANEIKKHYGCIVYVIPEQNYKK